MGRPGFRPIMGPMQRQWNQAISRLALAAVLALAFMPSLSRVVRVVSAPQPRPAQHHDHAGLAGMHHDMASMPGMHHPPAQQGHGGPAIPADGDCEYCPILASLSLPGVHVLAVPALAWPPHWDHAGSLGQPGRNVVAGLGARGPPMLG